MLFAEARPGEEVAEADIDAAHALAEARGWAVNSFAQVEFLLAYLLQRAALKWPVYSHFGEHMPFNVDTRIKRIRELIEIEGPLKDQASTLTRIVDDLATFKDFRHTMAHGFFEILVARNGHFVRSRRYDPKPGDDWYCLESDQSIEDLITQVQEAISFCSSAVRYFGSLFVHHALEDDLGPKRGPSPG